MTLRLTLTQDQYDELDAGLQEHYQQDGDNWNLATDGSNRLERALKSERRNSDTARRLLARLVPDIRDGDRYAPQSEWRALVDARADLLDELDEVVTLEDGEELDAEVLRRFLDGRGGEGGERGKGDNEENAKALQEAQSEARQLARENGRLRRELEQSNERGDELNGQNQSLVLNRDVTALLDKAHVTDPTKRRLAKALLLSEEYKLKVVDGETVVDRDGEEVPVSEWADDWAGTDEAKELATAPDNSGGGDGGRAPRRTKDGKTEETLTPTQKLENVFGGGDQTTQ